MIRVINGTVGVFFNGIMTPKTSKDEPFELNEKREAELVAAGIAAYVGTVKKEPEDGTPSADSGQTNDTPEGAENGAYMAPAYPEKMNLAQLKNLAEQYGVDASKMRKKEDVIAAIEAVKTETEEDEVIDDGEDAPDLSVEDPV